jgi:hypothetical protein
MRVLRKHGEPFLFMPLDSEMAAQLPLAEGEKP